MIDRPLGNPDARPARSDRVVHSMRALGKADLPKTITVAGLPLVHEATIKHDFFAATAFYLDPNGRRAVLKVGRVTDFAGFPLEWLGRWLCRRELHFYRRLSDLPNVPKVLGTVGRTGFVHEYVPGRPLSKDCVIPASFFDELFELFAILHGRGIAYVDTNKPQNILLGDDGRPHLIDFQISWDSEAWFNKPFSRWILKKLSNEDRYHVLKHKKRLQPDHLSAAELEQSQRKSWLIRIHRFVFKPYFLIRRRTFKRLRATGRLLPEGSK